MPFHLTTREFFEIVRRRLSPDGIFAANFVGQLMGGDGRLFWATYRTIQRQFGQVWVSSPYILEGRAPVAGNIIVYATISADPLDLEVVQRGAAELSKRWDLRNTDHYMQWLVHAPKAPDGIPELTDAYAPVEALQTSGVVSGASPLGARFPPAVLLEVLAIGHVPADGESGERPPEVVEERHDDRIDDAGRAVLP